MIRKLDDAGRIVIPKEMRRELGLEPKSVLKMKIEGKKLVLSPSENLFKCAACGKELEDSEIKICQTCLNYLKLELDNRKKRGV
jgi:transcriptional pleiotropic regulator of transition state genes